MITAVSRSRHKQFVRLGIFFVDCLQKQKKRYTKLFQVLQYSAMANKIPIWLDCDPGHDDAFAILLAAYHPCLELIGISTVYGNAPLKKTTENALKVLDLIGLSNVAVHPGAEKPFCRKVFHAVDIHGESGLDGTTLLPQSVRSALTHCNTVKDMRDSLMSHPADTVWLVATGTLTNAATLFAAFPEVIGHLKGLSIMGGAIGGGFTEAPLGPDFKDHSGKLQKRIGNTTPYAEFNIWCDPESAQSIFQNPQLSKKTTLITLDLSHQAFVKEDIRNMFLRATDADGRPTRMRQAFHELLIFFSTTYSEVFGLTEGPPLHDPLAVAVLLANIETQSLRIPFDDQGGERWDVDVILSGEETGRTRISPAQTADGVTIPRSLDLAQFWMALQDCLTHADEMTGFLR